MELTHWFIIAVTVLADGTVSLGHGTVLESFPSRSACEAALWDEFDRGYSAGYEAQQDDDGLRLILERNAGREVMQCLSPWTRSEPD